MEGTDFPINYLNLLGRTVEICGRSGAVNLVCIRWFPLGAVFLVQ